MDEDTGTLVSLPLDILHAIVYQITAGQISLGYRNFIGYKDPSIVAFNFECDNDICNYHSLLQLSSTCIFFRKLLGPVLFRHLSIIRRNQTDAILAVPKDFEMFSIRDQYYRELFREVLFIGFNECSKADLAKTGFKMINGDSSFKSRYQLEFSLNHFVEYIECGKELLSSGNLDLFPNAIALKILDTAFVIDGFKTICNIKYLALNVINIQSVLCIMTTVERIDIFIDFNEIGPHHLISLTEALAHSIVKECHLFISDAAATKYKSFINLIQTVCELNLEQFSLRLIRRLSQTTETQDWQLCQDSNGDLLIAALNRCDKLSTLTIDTSILPYLKFTQNDSYLGNRNLTLLIVEPTLIIPFFLTVFQNKLSIIIRIMNIRNLTLKFGDQLSESTLSALKILNDFIGFLSSTYQHNITNFSIEQCWSAVDETILRDSIRDEIFNRHKLTMFKPWSVVRLNSPKFRFSYYCRPSSQGIIYEDCTDNKQFWSVESSLVELEQYTRRQRKMSSIWG